jgi:lipoic acid synthetase
MLLKRTRYQKRTKSRIMLGLGETEEEVIEVLHDPANASRHCNHWTISTTLKKNTLPVKRIHHPEQFEK